MKQQKHKFANTMVSQVPESAGQWKDEKDVIQSYRTPQLFVVGKAVDLMKNNISGQLRDGTGGWYVWGS